MRIFARVLWRRGRQTTVECRKWRLSVLSLAIFSGTLEIRPTLLYSDMECLLFDFPLIHWPQNMWPWTTLSGHFTLNSVFTPLRWAWEIVAFEYNYVQTNKDRSYGDANVRQGFYSFWRYKTYADIRGVAKLLVILYAATKLYLCERSITDFVYVARLYKRNNIHYVQKKRAYGLL